MGSSPLCSVIVKKALTHMSSWCVKGLAYFCISPTLTAMLEFLFQFSFVVKCVVSSERKFT